MRTNLRRHALFAALLLAGLTAGGCKNEPATAASKDGAAKSDASKKDSAQVSEEQTDQATVVAVDKGARLVTLKNKDGKTFPVQCGLEVRNFDQIEVGNA